MAKLQRIPDGEYLKGLSNVTARIGGILSNLGDQTEDGMREIVADIRARAVELAPVDTGTLRGTAYDDVEVQGEQVVGSVHFPEVYAAYQHEHTEFDHDGRDGGSKYLEKAMLEKADQIRQKLAEALQNMDWPGGDG